LTQVNISKFSKTLDGLAVQRSCYFFLLRVNSILLILDSYANTDTQCGIEPKLNPDLRTLFLVILLYWKYCK